MKANKKCCVCGTAYAYCPTCVSDRNKPTWMNMFCSEECLNIYNVCASFVAGKINVNSANKKLAMVDLTKVSSNSMKATIAEIKSSVVAEDKKKNDDADKKVDEKRDDFNNEQGRKDYENNKENHKGFKSEKVNERKSEEIFVKKDE